MPQSANKAFSDSPHRPEQKKQLKYSLPATMLVVRAMRTPSHPRFPKPPWTYFHTAGYGSEKRFITRFGSVLRPAPIVPPPMPLLEDDRRSPKYATHRTTAWHRSHPPFFHSEGLWGFLSRPASVSMGWKLQEYFCRSLIPSKWPKNRCESISSETSCVIETLTTHAIEHVVLGPETTYRPEQPLYRAR